jgi:competence ComEA-like helix-hairpin-helix protein
VPVLTPDERRGAATIALLLCLGAGYDLWRLWTPAADSRPAAQAVPSERATPVPSELLPPVPPESIGKGPGGSGAGPGPLDLNRAGVAELDALPGIGPVLAARIVTHRERHGAFRRPEELLAVRGIGPRLFARLEGRIQARAPADSGAIR